MYYKSTKIGMSQQLPVELMDKISMMSDDSLVSEVLKKYTTKYAYNSVLKNINRLVYAPFISRLKKDMINNIKIPGINVLVIENSLRTLSYYKDFFKGLNMTYQVISWNTKKIKKCDVILVMANTSRQKHFNRVIDDDYNLFIDATNIKVLYGCVLRGVKNIHYTNNRLFRHPFERYDTIKIINSNYYKEEVWFNKTGLVSILHPPSQLYKRHH